MCPACSSEQHVRYLETIVSTSLLAIVKVDQDLLDQSEFAPCSISCSALSLGALLFQVLQPEILLCSNSSLRCCWRSSSSSSRARWKSRRASASSLRLRALSMSSKRRDASILIDATRRLPSHPPAPLFTISPCSSVLASALVPLSGDIGTSGAGTKATFRAASKLTFVLRFKLTFMCTFRPCRADVNILELFWNFGLSGAIGKGPHDTHRPHNSRVSQFSSC